MNMHKDKNIKFGERLRSLREKNGFSYTQEDIANAIGVHRNSYQRYEAGYTPHNKTLDKIVHFFQCSRDWLLTGIGNNESTNLPVLIKEKPAPNTQQMSNVIDLQHSELVKNFKDKERAKAINSALLELERLSPAAFEEIEGYIKGMVRGIQLAQGKTMPSSSDRRHDQRRTHNDQEAIPEDGDRRQGKSRRAVNGD